MKFYNDVMFTKGGYIYDSPQTIEKEYSKPIYSDFHNCVKQSYDLNILAIWIIQGAGLFLYSIGFLKVSKILGDEIKHTTRKILVVILGL